MRILDVDLDYFLDNIALDCSSAGDRLNEREFVPWPAERVRTFLEQRCGLSTDTPVPGKYVIHHDEAFHWWRNLIEEGALTTPFEVVHVDAHADLGAGMFSFSKSYVCFDLLHRPPEHRVNPEEGGMKMNAGNYLLIAIACRWLSKLVYVMHPKNNLEDCEEWMFTDFGEDAWTLSLPKLRKPTMMIPGMTLTPLDREPPVKFIPTVETHFMNDGTFDFMVLCQSPGFTPQAADSLIPVILEYMQPV
jgi:hypothetical protein